jgi:hypothetical protein
MVRWCLKSKETRYLLYLMAAIRAKRIPNRSNAPNHAVPYAAASHSASGPLTRVLKQIRGRRQKGQMKIQRKSAPTEPSNLEPADGSRRVPSKINRTRQFPRNQTHSNLKNKFSLVSQSIGAQNFFVYLPRALCLASLPDDKVSAVSHAENFAVNTIIYPSQKRSLEQGGLLSRGNSHSQFSSK